MKIGMVLDREFPPDDRVEKEALHLIAAGFEVHLLCFTFGKGPQFEEYKGIKVHRVFMPRWLFKKLSALILTVPFYARFWRKKMTDFVAANGIEALHIHDLPLVGVGLAVKQKFNIPLIADMHENYPVFISEIKFANTLAGRLLISKKKWAEKEREWLNRVDRIIVVNRGMQERIERQGVKDKQFVVVPNSPQIAEVLSSQQDLPELEAKYKDKFVVFYFGGLDSRRGLDTLIDAVPLLRRTIGNLRIVIVGQGSYRADLEEKIRKLQVASLVTFEGWHPVRHLRAFLQYAAVGVIPHLKSPQTDNSSPNKLFLYMLFKTPIVASNCRSIQEIIEENKCGLIFKSGDSNDLARRILYLHKNPEEGKAMGERGYRAVRQKYDWQVGAARMIEMYKGLRK